MIGHLARLGRISCVAILTLAMTLAALLLTLLAVHMLNNTGFALRTDIASMLAVGVALPVTLPFAWVLVGMLLRLYRDEQEMRSLATYDSLTGLLSRHAFFDNANNYVSLAKREKSPFSVLIIDLDHFKQINDRYGHPAGDAVLKLFADVVNSVARRSDIIGRLGGEEFAMVLPSTGSREALEFAGRLHQAIDKAVLKFNGSAIRYTASIGLTEFDTDSEDGMDELLARADLALYQAKQAGRNQTATFNPQLTQATAS